jgi:hypothetical protein
LRYALANPTLVNAIVGVVPACDLRGTYDLGDAGLAAYGVTQAEIRTAWGAADSAAFYALMATKNPYEIDLTPLAAIPMLFYYSTNDPGVPHCPEFAALVNAAGGNATAISQGAQGHTATVANIPTQDIIDFLAAH